METATKSGGLLYEELFQMTEAVDFGIDLGSILSGAAAPLPEGVRVHQGFTGRLEGARLKGSITGTDYLDVRADGAVQIHAHAVITTGDGKRIAYFATGIANFTPGAPTGEIRENVTLYSASPEYAWVNKLLVWATGKVDLSTGKISLTAYEA